MYTFLLHTHNLALIRNEIARMQNEMANYNTPKQYGMRVRRTNHGKR